MLIISFNHDNADNGCFTSKDTLLYLSKNYKKEWIGKLQPIFAYQFEDEKEIQEAKIFLSRISARNIKEISINR